MDNFLNIKARLPHLAGLELSARLMAKRPSWDIEIEAESISFNMPLVSGMIDQELGILEECLNKLECIRSNLDIELEVKRGLLPPPPPRPKTLGPWRLINNPLEPEESFQLYIPPNLSYSSRYLTVLNLVLTAIAEELSPPPGAPETKGKAALIMEYGSPLCTIASLKAGVKSADIISDLSGAARLLEFSALKLITDKEYLCHSESFQKLTRLNSAINPEHRCSSKWEKRFGLIVLQLSPYLAHKRLKILAQWLEEEGAIIIGGFSPGQQTALLLRSAAKAGLELVYTLNEGSFAAMKLKKSPLRKKLPPLSGSVVPALLDFKPVKEEPENEEEDLNHLDGGGLLLEDEGEDEEEF